MSWPLVKLDSVVEVLSGFAFKSSSFNKASQGVPIIRIQNVAENNSEEDFVYWDESYKEKFLIDDGDILLSLSGNIKLGIWGNGKALLNQRIIKISEKEGLDKGYLFYFLMSAVKSIAALGKEAVISNVSVNDFKALLIPLPPLETQKQIAAVLEKADQLRKDCQQMEQELNSLAQSVFIDMFGDPVTNPKGWEVRKLKEFYISEKDGTKCGPFGSALKKEEFVESGVPVWNMDNIALNGTFRDGASLWITKQKYEELDKYSVNQGDVIISRAGTVGKMGVVKSIYEQSIISTNLIRVRFGDKLNPLYFVCLMTYFKTRLKRLKVGDDGSFSHMNTGILDQLEFPYPPVEEQQKYIQFRSKLDDEIERLTSLKNEHECNFNSLMQKAFKGELNL
ncbi:restriction endonuclease subunit S [Vibrio vulnificus]|nr:restriction endonuclease subunit S [Vibrio vulnificus]